VNFKRLPSLAFILSIRISLRPNNLQFIKLAAEDPEVSDSDWIPSQGIDLEANLEVERHESLESFAVAKTE